MGDLTKIGGLESNIFNGAFSEVKMREDEFTDLENHLIKQDKIITNSMNNGYETDVVKYVIKTYNLEESPDSLNRDVGKVINYLKKNYNEKDAAHTALTYLTQGAALQYYSKYKNLPSLD